MPAINYEKIPKGRGFVYAYGDQLYRQTKKRDNVIYLKCHYEYCDGSAKLANDCFRLKVRNKLYFLSVY